jgi:glycosyltransferase involved in cell wall biosynthesis
MNVVQAKELVAAKAFPRVAVLMPAYNPGESINEAVDSLVRGTYPCDIYVVDDGSKVPITEILRAFPRTRIIRQDKNRGVAPTLNAGLAAILAHPYDFIARLDADDVAYPERIAKQVEFLDRHPDVAAVGSWARLTEEGSGRTLYIMRTPGQPEQVQKALYLNNVVLHPTAMIRTSVFRRLGPYSERYPVAEDYELFRRIAREFPVANIPSVLIDLRRSTEGVSLKRRRRQLFDRFRIQLKYFRAREPRAWAGLVKTLLAFLVPVSLIAKAKTHLARPQAGPEQPRGMC